MSASFTVFVCSTFDDLEQEREAVLDAIRRVQQRHSAMEFFGARTEQPIEICLEEVRKSDLLVVIVGLKYGSLPPGMGTRPSRRDAIATSAEDVDGEVLGRNNGPLPGGPANRELRHHEHARVSTGLETIQQQEALPDQSLDILPRHQDLQRQHRAERIPVVASDRRGAERLAAQGANGACHAFQSRDGIHKDAGWRRAVSRIQGMYGSRSVRRGEPAWLDLLAVRADPARPHGGFEASDALQRGVIIGIATDKIEPVACRAAGVSRACNELLGQDLGACTIVRDDRGRVLPWKINVYGGNVGLLAKEVEPFWILYAHNEQRFDLLRQQGSHDRILDDRIPQGAHDDRTKPTLARLMLESLRQACEEPVPIMRQDHPDESGA